MPFFMGAFPVLPGKEDDARKFAQETLGRGEDFSKSQGRVGATEEQWVLQETPMGALVLVRFDSPDIEAAFGTLATSTEDFDVWFRGRVLEICGVDLSAPPEGPLPEPILEWKA